MNTTESGGRVEESGSGPTQGKALTKDLFHAIAWTAAAKWTVQVLSWVSTLVMVRLLGPHDYGLIGMAGTFLVFVTLVSEFGIGSAVVTLQKLKPSEVSQLHGMSVLLGLCGTLVSAAAAIPLSKFFRAPEVAPLIAVMGIAFAVAGFRSVPGAMLQKDMDFRTLSWIDAVQSLLHAGSSVTLALLGAKYWSLALGGLVGTATGTALILWRRPQSIEWPMIRSIRSAVVFSWRVLVQRFAWHVSTNADFMIAGRAFGVEALGGYTVAYSIASLPGEKITSLVMRVTPSFFAAAQEQKSTLRHYLTLLTEALSIILFPILVGIGVVAADFVPVVLGSQWRTAVPPLQILAIATLLRSVASLLPLILNVIGETRYAMWNAVITACVLPGAFWVGTKWGITGVAMVWVLIYPLFMIRMSRRALRCLDLPVKEYFKCLEPAVVACVGMTFVVLGTRAILPDHLGGAARLAAQVAAGCIAYPAVLMVVYRDRIARYLAFGRRMVEGRDASL